MFPLSYLLLTVFGTDGIIPIGLIGIRWDLMRIGFLIMTFCFPLLSSVFTLSVTFLFTERDLTDWPLPNLNPISYDFFIITGSSNNSSIVGLLPSLFDRQIYIMYCISLLYTLGIQGALLITIPLSQYILIQQFRTWCIKWRPKCA